MVLDLGAKTVYEVKYDGKLYSLQEPTARQINAYQKSSSADESNTIESLLDFLSELGLPKEVGNELGISKLQMLTEHLTKKYSEKK